MADKICPWCGYEKPRQQVLIVELEATIKELQERLEDAASGALHLRGLLQLKEDQNTALLKEIRK